MKSKITYALVEKACNGNQQALREIIEKVSDTIYNLSLKMLLFPADAEDATQEILIKMITHLNTFKGESAFETWLYRVASNYLITLKSKNTEQFKMSFDDYASMLDLGQKDTSFYAKNEGELRILEEEVKISCTHGILLCLNSMDRIVYILGDILNIESMEAAVILDIKPDNLRKILSRSRQKIRQFMSLKCGLVNENNPCRCVKKIDFLIDNHLIDPMNLKFADKEKSLLLIEKIEEMDKSLSIFRGIPNFKFPQKKLTDIQNLIHSIKNN